MRQSSKGYIIGARFPNSEKKLFCLHTLGNNSLFCLSYKMENMAGNQNDHINKKFLENSSFF